MQKQEDLASATADSATISWIINSSNTSQIIPRQFYCSIK